MAAKNKVENVSVSKNGQKKDIPKKQWDAMKSKNSTYGWQLTSELSKEVLDKDKSIEDTKIKELEGKVGELSKENETLKGSISEKDTKIKELEGKVGELEAKVKELIIAKPKTGK